ncbi:DNA alkylation repair protein [Salinibius halmophilus]|uniref:DNA alkylation repair protein n=1 Tax=Salinibius halmophilus TaxID=1853216 RepID=UPI000E6756ED|nr:DNA alkylation repair protein [Salinibius halmophilus]
MTVDEVIAQLQANGDENHIEQFQRQGVKLETFGVSYSKLKRIAKTIDCDHELAEALWQAPVHDARALACMIVDLQAIASQREAWADAVDNIQICDAVGRMLSKVVATESAEPLPNWRQHENPWHRRMGWQAVLLSAQKHQMSDDDAEAFLAEIHRTIRGEQGVVQEMQLMALMAIGLIDPTWRAEVEQVAEDIADLKIKHPDSKFRQPDPIKYLEKKWDREDF